MNSMLDGNSLDLENVHYELLDDELEDISAGKVKWEAVVGLVIAGAVAGAVAGAIIYGSVKFGKSFHKMEKNVDEACKRISTAADDLGKSASEVNKLAADVQEVASDAKSITSGVKEHGIFSIFRGQKKTNNK